MGTRTCFSVVVPAYNRAGTIARTLGSVQRAADRFERSGGGSTEIVVVDDGSVDDTAETAAAIASIDPRVRVLRQPNAGVSAARNLGAAHATSEWLLFLDCDDEAVPEWLVGFDEALGGGARLVFAPARAVDAQGRERAPWTVEPLGPAFGGIDGLFNPGMFAVRREDFVAIGGYAPALTYSENTELGLRLTRHLERDGPIAARTIGRPLMTVTLPDGSGSNANVPAARLASAFYLLDEHGERLARDRQLLARYWAIAGVAAARLGRTAVARRCLERAALTDPTNLKHLARVLALAAPPLRRRLWAD